jgi:CheY-like chemotaxis protein
VDFLDLTKHALEKAGYTVACFTDRGEALAAMGKQRPDAIITDLMMESLDAGFSFSRQIREDSRFGDVPIVMVTAASSQRGFDFRPKGSEDLAQMRVDAFLEKPVSPKSLLAKVEGLMAARKRPTENAS